MPNGTSEIKPIGNITVVAIVPPRQKNNIMAIAIAVLFEMEAAKFMLFVKESSAFRINENLLK